MVGRVAIIALLVVAQCSGALLEGRSLVDVVELLSHPIMDDYGNEFPAYWMSFDCTSLGGADCTLSKKSPGDRNRTPETAKAFSMVVEAIRATVGSLLSDPSVNNDALEVVLRALLGPDSIDEFGLHVEDGKGEAETNIPNQIADANDSMVGDAAPAPIPLYVIGKSFTAHTFSVHFNMLKAEPYDVIDDGIEDESGGALQPSRQGDELPTAMFSKQLVVHMAVPVRASDSELEVIPVDVLIRCNVFEKRLFYQFRCLVQFCPKQSAGHDAHVDGDHFKH